MNSYIIKYNNIIIDNDVQTNRQLLRCITIQVILNIYYKIERYSSIIHIRYIISSEMMCAVKLPSWCYQTWEVFPACRRFEKCLKTKLHVATVLVREIGRTDCLIDCFASKKSEAIVTVGLSVPTLLKLFNTPDYSSSHIKCVQYLLSVDTV